MKTKYNLILTSVLFVIFTGNLSAQSSKKIQNIDFYAANENVEITYDIVDFAANESFDISISIFTESDRKLPAKTFSGDVGKNISGGKGKKIIWYIGKDNITLNEGIYILFDAVPIMGQTEEEKAKELAEYEAKIRAETEAKIRAEYEAKLKAESESKGTKEPKGKTESSNTLADDASSVSSSDPVKCETCFYLNPKTITTEEVKIDIMDIVALHESETKMKFIVENLGNPSILVRFEDFSFILDKHEQKARARQFMVIDKDKKDEFVVRTRNNGTRKEKLAITLNGLYKMDTVSRETGNVFKLNEKVTIGNFNVTMYEVKLKNDVKSSFKVAYYGEGIGLVDPMNLLLEISGKEYRPTEFQEKILMTNGNINEIRVDHNNYLKAKDPEDVRIINREALIDLDLVPLAKDKKVIFELDRSKSTP